MDNDRPVALVVGVSSAIGAAIARALTQHGHTVIGTSRQPHGVALPGVEVVALDVTSDDSVRTAVEGVLARTGRIDVVVNNAGVGVLGAVEESSSAQAQSIFETNVIGSARVINAVLPGMRRRGTGRIVNISSVVGLLPAPFNGWYSATKHAMEGYTESLDHEVREFGIRATLVQPAFTRTEFEANMWQADRPVAAYDGRRAAMQVVLAEAIGGAGSPDVVAKATLRAATDRRPRMRYPAGREARQFALLRRIAPAALFGRALRATLKLDTPVRTPAEATR